MQKFSNGDHVRVAKDLGESMSHFESDCEAIVLYSYIERYGGHGANYKAGDTEEYSIHIKKHGQHSWYYGSQLKLIEHDRLDLLEVWKKEEKSESNDVDAEYPRK